MRTCRRLLILACSARKRVDAELLPAIERYDGICYRVLRRWLRNAPVAVRSSVDILIMSAEFGLICKNTPVPYYDRKMNLQRALELAPRSVQILRECCTAADYSEIFLAMGSVYLKGVSPIEQWLPPQVRLCCTSGGIGRQAAQLRAWLNSLT